MHTGDVGHAALGVIVGRCFRCFVFDADCDTHPLPFSDSTCRDARANLLDATPAGIARQIENVRTACRCGQTEDQLGSECDAVRPALADDSCNDDACSTVCSGRTGDVEVDRGGFHETCHCGTPHDPCAGVVCGSHQHCSIDTGTCVADPGDLCAGVVCPIGTTCSPLNGLCQPSGGGTVDCEAECTMAGRCGGSIDVWTPTGPTTCSCSATSCDPFEVCDVWGYCTGPGQTCVLDGQCDADETCACDPACCGPGGGGDGGQCTWCGGPTISVSQCEACGGTISHFGTMSDVPTGRQAQLRAVAGGVQRRHGGGPGAMEAGHLGAYFAARGQDEIDAALALLAKAPAMLPIDAWLNAAFEVRAEYPVTPEEAARCPSVAMPTWLYGHEPPNAFATHVAKYFDNSVREEGVLAIGLYGVVGRRRGRRRAAASALAPEPRGEDLELGVGVDTRATR